MSNVHIKIDYDEAVASKKEVLLAEVSLLKTIKHMRLYNSLRKKEYLLKSRIKKDLSSMASNISKIEISLPEQHRIKKVQRSFEKENIKNEVSYKKEDKIEKIRKTRRDDIEIQIDEISKKLSELNYE